MFPKTDHEFIAHVDHSILSSQPGGQQACLFSRSRVCVCYTHIHMSCFFFFFFLAFCPHQIFSIHTSPTHAPSLGRVRAEGNHRITAAPAPRQGAPQHQQARGTWTESASSFAHDCRSVTGSASKTSSWGTEAAPTSIPREPADDDPSPQGGMIFSSQQSQTMVSSLTSMSLKTASCTF